MPATRRERLVMTRCISINGGLTQS
jgi:hypothetical protein